MYGAGTRTYNEGLAHGIVMSFWIGMRLGDSLCILEAIQTHPTLLPTKFKPFNFTYFASEPVRRSSPHLPFRHAFPSSPPRFETPRHILLLNPPFSAVRASTRLLPRLQQSRGNHCHHTVSFNPGENRLGTGRFQTAGGPILSI